MNVQITGSAELRRISPTALSGYLKAQGWERQEAWRNRVVVWSRASQGRVNEVLVPLKEQSDAYTVRMSELLTALAGIEDRSQLDVYYDVMGAGADTIRIRSLNGGLSDRSLSESVDLLGRTRDLMMAAARAAERPGQAVYRGRPSGLVTDYVRSIRPIPSYQTSRDITLHSRVPADYGVQIDLGDSVKPPFPRQAILTLDSGLREAESLAERVLGGGGLSYFDEGAQSGASANLCEAISGLVKQGHGVEVHLSWATVRPSNIPERRFAFGESSADVFSDGAHRLRQNNPFLDVHIIGEIVRLDRESQQDYDGKALVVSELDGRPVALRVQFALDERDDVLRAFRDGLEVNFDGDVVREGREFRMRELRNFSLAGN